MRNGVFSVGLLLATAMMVIGLVLISSDGFCEPQAGPPWKIHSMDRPEAPVVDPGDTAPRPTPGRPPSDAIVLFDGTDLSEWESIKGGPAQWKMTNGYMEIAKGKGDIVTKQPFGDC